MKKLFLVLLMIVLAFALMAPALADAAEAVTEAAEAVTEEAVAEAAEAAGEAEEAAEAVEEPAPESWADTAFKDFKETNWYTWLALAALVIGGVLILKLGRMGTAARWLLAACCFGLATALALVSLFRSLSDVPATLPYIITIVCLLAVMITVICLQRKERWTARAIASAAMCMAIAFVLSMIKLFRMPQAGTVTPAALLPLIMFTLAFGPSKGLVVGCAYGLLQIIEDPYVIHPIQLLVDYPMAFGATALCYLAVPFTRETSRARLPVAVVLGYLGRFVMAVISGVVFFSEYAGEQNAIVYSVVYNISYLGVEMVIAAVITMVPGFSGLVARMKTKS